MSNKFAQEYVSINGISQYFLHIPNDSKNVIIMLHGGPLAPNSYLAYHHQSYLDFCNVVYYDQRGSGKTQIKSKTKPENLSFDILIEDLRQTIQYVKEKYSTDRVFLVGHSYGTMIGTEYIKKYPHDVAGYIGYGQAVDMPMQNRSWYEYTKKAIMSSGKRRDIKKINSIDSNFPNIERDAFVASYSVLVKLAFKYSYHINNHRKVYTKSPLFSLRDGMQMGFSEKPGHSLVRDVEYDYSIRNTLKYDIPIYYVLGRYDEWTTSTIAAEYFETIEAPSKGLHWIENAGHMVDIDNPSALFSTIKKILEEVS